MDKDIIKEFVKLVVGVCVCAKVLTPIKDLMITNEVDIIKVNEMHYLCSFIIGGAIIIFVKIISSLFHQQ